MMTKTRNSLHWILVLLILLILSGCASPAASLKSSPTAALPPATDTPPPPTPTATDTPEPPTATPAPTNTPKPTATATPDRAATAAAQATQAAEAALADIQKDLESYGLPEGTGRLAWLGTEAVEFHLTEFEEQGAELLDPDLYVSDFVLQTEVTWNSTGGLAGCGLILRADPDLELGAHYRFVMIRLSGLPAWGLTRWDYGYAQASLTRTLQTSGLINQGQGATNKMAFVAQGGAMSIYANGKRVRTMSDSKLSEGLLGVYSIQESGETTCSFANTWVWDLSEE